MTLSLISQFMRQTLRSEPDQDDDQLRTEPSAIPGSVRSNSKIRARVTLQSIKDLSDGMEASYSVVVERQDAEKPCCVAEWVLRYYR